MKRGFLLALGATIYALHARADGLFPFVNPYDCVYAAKGSTEPDNVRRFNLAVCLHRVRSPIQAVQVLQASGFNIDPLRARKVELDEKRGDLVAAAWALHHLVIGSDDAGVPGAEKSSK